MSGGGSGVPPGGPTDGEPVACELLNARTHLDSPNPTVKLEVGQILTVRLRQVGSSFSLEAVTDRGEVAGTVNPPTLPRFIECIQGGHNYVARVLSVSGGFVQVEIRPAAT